MESQIQELDVRQISFGWNDTKVLCNVRIFMYHFIFTVIRSSRSSSSNNNNNNNNVIDNISTDFNLLYIFVKSKVVLISP